MQEVYGGKVCAETYPGGGRSRQRPSDLNAGLTPMEVGRRTLRKFWPGWWGATEQRLSMGGFPGWAGMAWL